MNCRLISFASTANDLVFSFRKISGGVTYYKTYVTGALFSDVPVYGPDTGDDDASPAIEAHALNEALCVARSRFVCRRNSDGRYAKAWEYGGPGITVNGSYVLFHHLPEGESTVLRTQLLQVDDGTFTSDYVHITNTSTRYPAPPGTRANSDNEALALCGRWARLSNSVYLSHWITNDLEVSIMHTFDVNTGSYGNVTFDVPQTQFEIMNTDQLGGVNVVYVAARQSSGSPWSLYKITLLGLNAAAEKIPVRFSVASGSVVSSALIIDRANTSIVFVNANGSSNTDRRLTGYSAATGEFSFGDANFATSGSTSANNPNLQLWPFLPHSDTSKRNLVDYAAAIVRTFDESTKTYSLTLITGFTHPDDRCDISTETRDGVTYNYAADVVEVVTAADYAVLVLVDPRYQYPLRKVISRSCAPGNALAPPLLYNTADRANSTYATDVWCSDTLFFKLYRPADATHGDFLIGSWHPDNGELGRKMKIDSENSTLPFSVGETDRRTVIQCAVGRTAIVAYPAADRLRLAVIDRSQIYRQRYQLVDDDPSIQAALNNPRTRPTELVGHIGSVAIFTNSSGYVFGYRSEPTPAVLPVNTNMTDVAWWSWVPRNFPARWISLKQSAWFYDPRSHNIFRLTVNPSNDVLWGHPGVDPHSTPYASQVNFLPNEAGIIVTAPFSPYYEQYRCLYNDYDECLEAVQGTGGGTSIRWTFQYNNSIWYSEGASPMDPLGASVTRSPVNYVPTNRGFFQKYTVPLNSLIPYAIASVQPPVGSATSWNSNGVVILLLRTVFGVEPVALGPSTVPPLPPRVGIDFPLIYPTRITPIPVCPGVPPTSDFVCVQGVWTFFGSKNITSTPVVVTGTVSLRGNLTLSNVTLSVGGTDGYLNISECLDLSQGPFQFQLTAQDIANASRLASGIRIVETLGSCAQSMPTSFSVNPDAPSCERYDGQLQYRNSTDGSDRVSLSVIFTVDSLQCKIWWISLASALGGAVLLAIAITVIALKCCRRQVLPFSARRESGAPL